VRGLPAAGIELNRRVLSELAATEPFTFKALVETARAQLEAEKAARKKAVELR
jgi:large subunit ribosomal protein L20